MCEQQYALKAKIQMQEGVIHVITRDSSMCEFYYNRSTAVNYFMKCLHGQFYYYLKKISVLQPSVSNWVLWIVPLKNIDQSSGLCSKVSVNVWFEK